MSKTHTNDIWELNLPPTEKLVYLALYWRQGPTGCHPTIDEIARMTGCSKSTVHRAIKNLRKRGLLDVDRQRHKTNPRHQKNRYTLKPTAQKDVGDALRQLIGTPVTVTPVTPVTVTLNTGQIDPITPVTVTGNRTTDRKRIGAGSKMTDENPEKTPANAGRMSRAEALAKYGTGQPIPTASIAQTTLTQILDRARIETSPQ